MMNRALFATAPITLTLGALAGVLTGVLTGVACDPAVEPLEDVGEPARTHFWSMGKDPERQR